MISITKMAVKSFDLDSLDIYWEISPIRGPNSDTIPHEVFNYEFFVMRSESVMGPYDQIAGPLRDTYHIKDIQISLSHKWREYFYTIKVLHVPTGESQIFGPVASDTPEPDLISLEIIRQEHVLFTKFVGRKCYVFPKRTFGPACTCYDPVLRRLLRSSHSTCFDTGWLGGYMSPIESYVQIDPVPKAFKDNPLSQFQERDTSARMTSFPPVKPGDIIVEPENRRWKVMSISTTERLKATVRQELRIHEIPRGDIEYNLPINTDSSKPDNEDNFTNEANIEADGDYNDIFAVFGHPRGAI